MPGTLPRALPLLPSTALKTNPKLAAILSISQLRKPRPWEVKRRPPQSSTEESGLRPRRSDSQACALSPSPSLKAEDVVRKGLHEIFSYICSSCHVQARSECLVGAFFSCKGAAGKQIGKSYLTRQGKRACRWSAPGTGASLCMCPEHEVQGQFSGSQDQTYCF